MPDLNPGETHLVRGLRILSRSAPQEAPPLVRQELVTAFRRHHARARHRRLAGIAAMAAGLAVAAGLMLAPDRQLLQSSGRDVAAIPAANTQSYSPSEATRQFIPVLYGQQPPGEEPTIVVRLQMPASALRLVGVPVAEDAFDRPVLTEVIVGHDGLPYAVRLLPTSNQGVKQ